VFNDEREKEYELINEVMEIIKRKKSKVVFVMNGECGDKKNVG
jgi:hypothetical protein